MAWIRIDDCEADHPKVLALVESAGYEAYYRLARLRGYCARQGTDGRFTRSAARELGVKPRQLEAMIAVGLVDVVDEQTLQIHDWTIYNGRTVAERVAAYLADHPGASANEVLAVVGGRRELVLAELGRLRGGTKVVPGNSPGSTPGVPGEYRGSSRSSTKSVLSPVVVTDSSDVYRIPTDALDRLLAALHDRDPDTEETIRRLALRGQLGEADFARALDAASGPGVRSPARVAVAELAKLARRGAPKRGGASAYTGCRHVRGTHGMAHVRDPLGTDPPPAGWPHPPPTQDEIQRALGERERAPGPEVAA
jgi:hypothetical protein